MKYNFQELWDRLPKFLRKSCEECIQDPMWHSEGSVKSHIQMVFEYAEDHFADPRLLICAIFHDLGKPETTTQKDLGSRIKTSHYGHEMASLKYIDMHFDLYADITTDREAVYEICKDHMKAHLYKSGDMSKPLKRKTFENSKYFELSMQFEECDSGGSKPNKIL